MTKSSAVEFLLPIWQRVLQRSSIRAEDNFFDLGGSPASAAQLFAEVAKGCGRHLPAVLIYSAPTIEALAQVLEQPEPPRVPPLLLLKAGTVHPPVFIAHGLGDTVFDLFRLVNTIESPHPIYGMQARGIDGIDPPLASVEEMSQFHLEAIKQAQAHGPYFLIGYSLGGLVALEIAQRLCAGGEKVALLALVDSYPHRTQLSLIQNALLSFRLAKRRILSPSAPLGRTRSEHSESVDRNPSPGSHIPESMSNVTQRMRDSAYQALRRCRPQYYDGRIDFVRPAIVTDFPDDPAAVWSHLAAQFEVETIPGNHWSMLTNEFEKLGSVLSGHLRKATREHFEPTDVRP
ncbi:MAG: alpha/beta fold hydrolase [Candidatus Sulfotelmatobacter sp.]